MPDVKNSTYFHRGRSQNWKTWKFRILTPCARSAAYRHQQHISQFQKRFQQLGQMPRKCPPPDTKALAPTVYPLQGRKADPNLKKKIGNTFFRLHYDQKNTLIPLVKSVFKSVHNNGRYLHFCDRHVCSIQYAAKRRLQPRAWPILCTGLRPAQLFLVSC